MGTEIDTIIREIGWDNTYRLPVASKENQLLETEVKQKNEELEELRTQIEISDTRIKNLENYFKNLKNELSQTQQLVKAHEKEIEAEEHMIHLAYREDNWLQQEIKRLQKELQDVETKCNRHETAIENHQQRLKKAREEIQTDEQSLEEWLNEIARQDDDVIALQQYSNQDETKLKELVLQMKRLEHEVDKEKQKLAQLNNESRCAQMEMDKTAEEYRNIHNERQHLVQQWELAVQQIKIRDNDINNNLIEIGKVKRELKRKKSLTEEKTQFLNQMKRNNVEEEKLLTKTDGNLLKLRIQIKENQTDLERTTCEMIVLKNSITNAALELQTLRGELKHRENSIEEMKKKYQFGEEDMAKLQNILNKLNSNLLNTNEKVALSEKMFQDEEYRCKNLEQEINHMMDSRYRKQQELEKTNNQEKILAAEIQGCHTSIQNLKKRLLALERMAQRQEEVIYGQDIVIQQIEDKLSRMSGQTNVEEKNALEQKIAQLQEVLDEKVNTINFIIQQGKLLEEDIARHKRQLDKQIAAKDDIVNKMTDLELYIENSEQEMKNKIAQKQNLMVDENLLKLKIKKQQDELSSKVDQVYTLEKRKLQLETVMKERLLDINAQRDLLRTEIRINDEERQTLNIELNNRMSKIEQLKKRYEIFIAGLDTGDCGGGGEGDQPCHIQYFVKAIQEKQRLQLEGDELDAKIHKAEQEIVALENTLRLMNTRTENLRRAFNPITKTSEECEEKQQMEEQVLNAKEKYRVKKQQKNEIANEVEKMNQTKHDLSLEENALNYNCQELSSHLSNLGYQLQEQFQKLDRATLQKSKQTRMIRKNENSKNKTPIEFDVDLRLVKEANKFFIQNIKDFLKQHPEHTAELTKLFAEANLPSLNTDMSDTSSLSVRSASSYCSSRGNQSSYSSRISSPPSVVTLTLPSEFDTNSGIPKGKQCSLNNLSGKQEKCSTSKQKVSLCQSENELRLLAKGCGSEIINIAKHEKHEEKLKTICKDKGITQGKVRVKSLPTHLTQPAVKSKSVCSVRGTSKSDESR